MNKKWWMGKVAYQIWPKSFADSNGDGIGDLEGIIGKLDYLKELGVDIIWISPVYQSPLVDQGYDISDYYDINPLFGDMDTMDRLLAEAKKRDMYIIMDLVVNHCSDEHEWFQKAMKDPDGEYGKYFYIAEKKDGKLPCNWRSYFGGSVWEPIPGTDKYYLHSFHKKQPDLNWENPEVRKALFAAANFWLDKGVGGFRIDAIVYIKKPEFKDGEPDGPDGLVGIHEMTANTPGILDFLHEFRREVFDGHDIFTVGEANGVSPEELPLWVGENGVFSMLFEFSHLELSYPEGEIWCKRFAWTLGQLKDALSASQAATAKEGWYPIFFENHDQNRSMHRYFPEGTDPKTAAKALATVLFTLRGTPFVYEGEEIGMTNTAFPKIEDYNDISTHGQYEYALEEGFSPEEALKAVQFQSRDNARTPMQWTRDTNAGFTTGKPWLPVHKDFMDCCVEAESEDGTSVLSYYRQMNRERTEGKASEILLQGSYEELLHEDEHVYAFKRVLGEHAAYTVVNFTNDTVTYDSSVLEDADILIGNYENAKKGTLRPAEAVVYVK